MPEIDEIKKAKDLLEKSYDALKERKTAQKHMGMIASDVSKLQNVEKSILMRCKDYVLYKGQGWDINELEKSEAEVKFTDKIAPVFKKFLQIIEDCYAVGKEDLLDDYFDALRSFGVDVTVTDKSNMVVSDADEVDQAITAMGRFQKTINEVNREINDEHTSLAEELSFTPKKDYKSVLGLYEKKKDEKDVDDMYQQKVTDLNMIEAAYNAVYDDAL